MYAETVVVSLLYCSFVELTFLGFFNGMGCILSAMNRYRSTFFVNSLYQFIQIEELLV